MNDGEKKAQHVFQTMKYRNENANAVHIQQSLSQHRQGIAAAQCSLVPVSPSAASR